MATQSPAFFSWQQPLAMLFGGLSAAGQPGGFNNFGAGVNQAGQNWNQNQMEQQRSQWLQDQADREQQRFDQETRRANQEEAQKAAANKQIAAMFTGGTPHFVGGAGGGNHYQPGQPAMFQNLSPEQRSLVQQSTQIDPIGTLGFLQQQAFAQPKDDSTPDIKEYNLYKQQGGTDDFTTWLRGNRQASRSITSVNMPGNPTPDERGRGAFAEANAKAQAQYFDNVATAGTQANQRLGDINQLIALMEVTPQGAGQEWLNKGAAIASRFGIDAGEYANVPAAQAFQSIVSRIAPTLRVQGSGATSDFEMRQFLSSLPAIANMPDGNRIIASNLKKISERSVQEAYIANQVQGGDLTPAQGRKKILDLGPLDLDLPHLGNTPPAGGPGGAPDNGVGGTGVRYEDNLPEGFN